MILLESSKRKHVWRRTGADLMPELVEEDDRAIAL